MIGFTIRRSAYGDYGYHQRMIARAQAQAWERRALNDADDLKREGVCCKVGINRLAS